MVEIEPGSGAGRPPSVAVSGSDREIRFQEWTRASVTTRRASPRKRQLATRTSYRGFSNFCFASHGLTEICPPIEMLRRFITIRGPQVKTSFLRLAHIHPPYFGMTGLLAWFKAARTISVSGCWYCIAAFTSFCPHRPHDRREVPRIAEDAST